MPAPIVLAPPPIIAGGVPLVAKILAGLGITQELALLQMNLRKQERTEQ